MRFINSFEYLCRVLPLSKKSKYSNEIDVEKSVKKTDVEVVCKKDNSVKIVTENASDTETEIFHEDVTIDNADSEEVDEGIFQRQYF